MKHGYAVFKGSLHHSNTVSKKAIDILEVDILVYVVAYKYFVDWKSSAGSIVGTRAYEEEGRNGTSRDLLSDSLVLRLS
jgi:hypothetical protein